MQFTVAKEIFERYPDLRIGVIVVKGANNTKFAPPLKKFIEKKVQEILNHTSWEDIRNNNLVRLWRDVYRNMGVSPKKKKPTLEALVKRVWRTGQIPLISPVVSLYLLIELERLLPIGGYDLEKINGGIILRKSTGNEEFAPLGGGIEYTLPNEIVYSDDVRVLTRIWNYKDSDYTKITENTKSFVLMTEAPFAYVSGNYVLDTLGNLADYFNKFVGGKIVTVLVDKNNPKINV